ncbi:MAG: DUF169 domain-containing protein [Anaerolineales bacterium]|nr:DUF169 domain-containing protein [Anaerolineales bacterium]
MKNRKDFGKQLIEMLNLTAWPVGVDFISSKDARPQQAQLLKGHRYCQALMKAREGSSVLLDSKGISCPAAAAAFGFRPLPENLQNGRGLVGFGIVQEQNTGARMFEGMSYFPAGQIDSLHLYPLGQAERLPDVVVMEDEPEKLMWISLAYLNLKGGERVVSSTAVLQATCVDSTIIPHQEQRLNQSFGCYGCRDATDMDSTEAALGFPGKLLPDLLERLEYLKEKAIPVSRSKKAYAALQDRFLE